MGLGFPTEQQDTLEPAIRHALNQFLSEPGNEKKWDSHKRLYQHDEKGVHAGFITQPGMVYMPEDLRQQIIEAIAKSGDERRQLPNFYRLEGGA